jgi:EAL domain-containing protein (putative c-di-GMP-specific phosphodiesterase class I)
MTRICEGCRDGEGLDFPFTMAFQPIVDIRTGTPFAYEALVRGVNGEGAGTILQLVDEKNRYAFDQQCRVKAIEMASALGLSETGARLSINFMPNAVYEPRACIRLTLATAMRTGFPTNRIIFEFTEDEELDVAHVTNILRAYKAMGFMTAIDDFGAGHAGLKLLARFQPDIVKLDMDLIRDVDSDSVKQRIVRHLLRLLEDLGIQMLCEGVETPDELATLTELGVRHVQGYLLARPGLAGLPRVNLDTLTAVPAAAAV